MFTGLTECVFYLLVALVIETETEFPNITVRGCYFHFNKSIWGQVQELGLVAPYNHIPQIRNTIRRLISLRFVPLPLVRMCLGNLQRAAAPLQVQAPALSDLFLYFWCNYISGKVQISMFSVSAQKHSEFDFPVSFFVLWQKRKNTTAKSNQEIQPYPQIFFVRPTKELPVAVISICVSCYIINSNGNLYLLCSLANYLGHGQQQ